MFSDLESGAEAYVEGGSETLGDGGGHGMGGDGRAELSQGDRRGTEARPATVLGGPPEQVGLVEGESVEQDGAVLEHRAIAVHLCRSAQLALPYPQIGALLTGEAHGSRVPARVRDRRVHPELGEPRDEGAGKEAVQSVDARAARVVGSSHRDRVGEIRAVEEGAAAGGTTHDLDAEVTTRVVVDVVFGLEATQ